jgi:acyl carrier protein phosphodiesterase
MNLLAHAWLSFQQPEILVGNMISDFVKGKKQFDYPGMVQKGIRLHRAIDTFTDAHPVTGELKAFFRPQYRLYAGAFADVVYDHFLANDHNEFSSPDALKEFTAKTYLSLENNARYFPEPFRNMFPYMRSQDWLFNYRTRVGIEKSFGGLVRRSAYLTESDMAYALFNLNYDALKSCYAAFFPSLKTFAAHQYQQLINN